MKLTTATLRKLIKEELNNVLNEGSHEQIYNLMVREMDYGVVGSVRQSPVDYGRYEMNNGVIGIIPPNQSRGNQYYPARKMGGNPQAVFAKLKEMGYQREGMPLDRSNDSEESLRRIADK
jgi:hypothetical protein